MDVVFNWLSVIGTVSGAVAIALLKVFQKSTQSYVDEKARNMATLEDTAKITAEIESVNAKFELSTYAKKHLFDKEYDLLREVWKSTWEFQAMARSLRPILDSLPEDMDEQKKVFLERYNKYGVAVQGFRETVVKNKPFMPQDIYDLCLSLRQIVIRLQINFESSLRNNGNIDWDKIWKWGEELDAELDKLSDSIRKHIYT